MKSSRWTAGARQGVAVGAVFAASAGAAPLAWMSLSHAEGPPNGRTGGFGDPSCHECHLGFDLNLGGSLSIEGLPAAYEPGASYVLSVVLRSTEMTSAGFQMAARFADGTAAGGQAGSFQSVDSRVAVVPDSVSDVVYAQHAAGSVASQDSELATWNVEWTAPDRAETVLFHAAANSGNGDNSPLGDLVYTTEARAAPEVVDGVRSGARRR
jgi:hypothetical protein